MMDFGLGLFAASGWLFALWLVWHFTNRAELPQSETECPHGRSKLKFCKDCSREDPLLKEPEIDNAFMVKCCEEQRRKTGKGWLCFGAVHKHPMSIAEAAAANVVQVTEQNRLLMKCPECQKEYEAKLAIWGNPMIEETVEIQRLRNELRSKLMNPRWTP